MDTRVPMPAPRATEQPDVLPGHTRPAVTVGVNQDLWEQLIAQRAATAQLLDAHDRMQDYLTAATMPAQFEPVTLTQTQPVFESRERVERPSLSIGVYNPNPITVYFSTIGSATPGNRAWAVPANTLLIVPISAASVELGAAAADLAAGAATVQLLRFFTVQPAFLGQWT